MRNDRRHDDPTPTGATEAPAISPPIRRTVAALTACLLAVTACASEDDSSDAPAATPNTATTDDTVPSAGAADDAAPTTPTTETPPDTEAPSSTDAPVTTVATTDAPTTDAPVTTAAEPASDNADGLPLLEGEFQPVDAGRYRVETIGAPFVIDVPEGWWVQPNSAGQFVLTDEASQGPGDRDIVMIRPRNLADPDQPSAPVDEQAGDWPLDDIGGWLDALVPGIVDGEPINTTVGGLAAVQFDVSITDDYECGEGFCAGFASNRLVNAMWFQPDIDYRVWWIDGGNESPIAINIGAGDDPAFVERAEAVLETLEFESVDANPIPAEGELWEAGITSDVPAGTASLPVGPGITIETSEPTFIVQDGFKARILPDAPAEVDVFFPDQAIDGVPVTSVDDVVEALGRVPDLTTTVVGTRTVLGAEATELTFSSTGGPPEPGERVLALQHSSNESVGWTPSPDGVLWVAETSAGLLVITAEWFDPEGVDAANALADEILATISIAG